jgi:hypothetical protein
VCGNHGTYFCKSEKKQKGELFNENKGVRGSLFVFSTRESVKRMKDGIEEKDYRRAHRGKKHRGRGDLVDGSFGSAYEVLRVEHG